MIKLSTKTLWVIGGFSAYAIFLFINYIRIAEFIAHTNIFLAVIAYILFNPVYLLIIYGIWNRFKSKMAWKRILASVISILSLDFLSIPRLTIDDALTNGAAITTNIGSIVMRALETIVSHDISYMLMYLILPIVGFAISVELLGITNFIRERT